MNALSGTAPIILAIVGAVLTALVYSVDRRIGLALIFIIVLSLLGYAVKQGQLKGNTP